MLGCRGRLLQEPGVSRRLGERHARVRAPLGSLESRTLKSATPSTSLPGAPDGDYVVMQFDTSFERKKDGGETVTAVQETDGVWRIVGYFIR